MATAKKTTSVKGEKAVRDYLAAVADPSITVSQAAVKRAQTALDKCTDPVKALDLFKELEAARTPDLSKLEEAFVRLAFQYAEKKGIPAEAFLAQGVSREVLRGAGFTVRAGKYKDRVDAEVVVEHIRSLKDPFTITEVFNATDASRANVANIVNDLVERGELQTLEPESTGRPGKPATRFANV